MSASLQAGRDAFESQPSLELLRQWCCSGGWHDDETPHFKEVVGMQLVGVMTTSSYQKQ